jgi:hypothetical protein
MDARDRVNALLTGRGSFDREGLFEHFWAETPLRWMHQGYPAAAEAGDGAAALPVDPNKVLVKHGAPSFVGGGQAAAPMNPYRYFDYDMHPCGGLFDVEPLVFPYYAELNQFFHSHGLPAVLHSCGNVTQALPLILDAGFDALQPLEVKAGCDPFAFAEQYGDRLALIGGLDVASWSPTIGARSSARWRAWSTA